MNSTHFVQQDPTQIQIESFITLVKEVNCIPGVKISLKEETDLQRDALAFMVDTVYRQFKNDDWPLMMRQLPLKIRMWNTPPDGFNATRHLLKFIQHLVNYRIIEMLEAQDLPDSDKQYITALHNLYQVSTDATLKNAKPGFPIFFGGISYSLLPEWYIQKNYL